MSFAVYCTLASLLWWISKVDHIREGERVRNLVADRRDPSAKLGIIPSEQTRTNVQLLETVNTLASEQHSEVSETSTSCNSLLTRINIYTYIVFSKAVS